MNPTGRVLFLTFAFSLIISAFAQGAEIMQGSFVPKQGFVPDERTAITIAEAVLVPIYGKDQVDEQKPFVVGLADDVWKIHGTRSVEQLGGVFSIEISKQTATILRVTHGR